MARDHTHKRLIADAIYSPEYQHHPKHVKTQTNMATDTKNIIMNEKKTNNRANGWLTF